MSKESFPTGPLREIIREESESEKDAEILQLRNEIKRITAEKEMDRQAADTKIDALMDLHVRQDDNLQEEHEKQMIDDLTGLGNYKAFVEKFEDLTAMPSGAGAEQRRKWIPVTLLTFDLDGFKEVNDTYGHAAGDLVLQQAAAFLKKLGREGEDAAYRFHGDEFAMVFFNVEPEELIRRFREAEGEAGEKRPTGEASLPFSTELPSLKDPSTLEPVNVTASGGLVEVLPGASLEEILKRGDDALYDAKRAGKNRVHLERRNVSGEN